MSEAPSFIRNPGVLLGVWLCAAVVPAHAQPPLEPALARTALDPGLEWGPCPAFFPEGCSIAVLHGDPAQPNADIFFKVPPGYAIPAHWHTSAERMVLVSGRLRVSYEGQDEVVLDAGDYAYGPAERVHEGACDAGESCVLFIAFEAPVDALPVGQAADWHPAAATLHAATE